MALREAPRAPSKRLVSGLLAFALGAAFSCGPSLKNMHEGTVRFEHCNRLDLDEKIAKNECKKCWSSWLAEYTYGQPRDRIDYARRRARALSNGDEGARPVLKTDERNPDERQFYLVVPGPTNMRAPPPPIATVWKDGDGDAGSLAKVAADSPPAESCADDCRTAWQSCSSGCANGNGHTTNGRPNGNGHSNANGSVGGSNAAGKPGSTASSSASGASGGANPCAKCGNAYSSCMKRCFE